jgi:hypothetical protein
MLMEGESVYKVAKLLGDTVKTVESVYGHYSPMARRRQAASYTCEGFWLTVSREICGRPGADPATGG